MNIRSALKTVLLPVCLDTTARMRAKLAEQVVEDTHPLMSRVKWAVDRVTKIGLDKSTSIAVVESMVAIAHGPENIKKLRVERLLETPTTPVLDPLTVIVFSKDSNGHGNELNKPYLVTSGKNRKVLNSKGHSVGTTYDDRDWSLADDLTVEKCIDTLNESQVRTILSDTTVFAPVLSSLLETPDPTEQPKAESASTSS